MNYLLLFVSFFFGIIFNFFYTLSLGRDFFFHKGSSAYSLESLSGNIFIETFIFVMLGIFFFFSFSDFSKKKWDISNQQEFWFFEQLWTYIKNFFKKYIYFFWFLFFYISSYIILKNYSIDFSYFIFIINSIVLFIFLINKKIFIIRDLLRVNTILFSIIYIAIYSLNLFWWKIWFFVVDFINSFFLLFLYIVVIYSDMYVFKKERLHSFFIYCFSVFLFFFLIFNTHFFFSSLSFVVSIISFFLSLIFFYILPELNLFKKNIWALKYVSLFLNYLWIISACMYLVFYGFNIFIFFILFTSWGFNFFIHQKFQNYISFIFWYISILIAMFSFYFHFLFFWEQKHIFFLIFTVFLEVFSIGLTFFIQLKNIYDYIIVYVFSYSIIIFWLVYFFISKGFDIFIFWIILLLLSLSIFSTYYKINSINKQNK